MTHPGQHDGDRPEHDDPVFGARAPLPEHHRSPQHSSPQQAPQHTPERSAPHGEPRPDQNPPDQNPPDQVPPARRAPSSDGTLIAAVAWAAAVIVVLILGGFAVWAVDTQVYTAEALGEEYWEAVESGDGAAVLGQFGSAPEAAGEAGDGSEDARLEDGSVDSVLLDGEALEHSSEQIEDLSMTERSGAVDMTFSVDGEEHESRVPMDKAGESWGFFDEWVLDPAAVAELSLSVPGARAGGIGQVEVNGEPVNLEEDAAELVAWTPTVVDVAVDSDWLTGSAHQVLVNDPEEAGGSGDEASGPSEELEIELEASSAAADLLHQEISDYLSTCAEQQVLMPAGCPMGVETPNRVDASTIEWEMPSAEDVSLSFGPDGWSVSGESSLTATVTFESTDYYNGDDLDESHDVSFGLDVQVGASGEDLLVSVTGD